MSERGPEELKERKAERVCQRRCDGARTVAYKPALARLAGDRDAGLLLSQILYWFRDDRNGLAKTTVERAGVRWLAKRRKEWQEELEMPPRVVDRCMARLELLGVVRTAVWRFGASPRVHITVEWEVLRGMLMEGVAEAAAEEAEAVEETVSTSPGGDMDITESGISYKEEITLKDYKNNPHPTLSPGGGEVQKQATAKASTPVNRETRAKATAGATAAATTQAIRTGEARAGGMGERSLSLGRGRAAEAEPEMGSEAWLLEEQMRRVLLACGVTLASSLRLDRRVVRDALAQYAAESRKSVAESADLAVRNWREYERLGAAGLLTDPVGFRRFFRQVWRTPALWRVDRTRMNRL